MGISFILAIADKSLFSLLLSTNILALCHLIPLSGKKESKDAAQKHHCEK